MEPKDFSPSPDLGPLFRVNETMEAVDQAAEEIRKRKQRELEVAERTAQAAERTADAAENIDAKIDVIDKDLHYILDSIGANEQRVEGILREERQDIIEIIYLLQNRGSETGNGRIRELLKDKTPDAILTIAMAFTKFRLTGTF